MRSILNFGKIRFYILSITIFFSCVTLLNGKTANYGKASDYGFIEGVNYTKNVVYKEVDGQKITMDVFYPKTENMSKKNPWMVFVHGGGWAGGSKDNIFRKAYIETLKTLLKNGVVCFSIEYRRAKAPFTTYESVIDCKDATKFLLKNAKKYKLDKKKYGIWGGSAGGHLSLVTALVPDSYFPGDKQLSKIHPKYKCVASYFPFTSCLNPDLRPASIFEDEKLFIRLLGGTLEEKPELARLLSPTEFLKENSPSILLLHGDKDATLPIINSQYMMKVAKEKNADVKLLTIKNAGHSFSGNHISPSFTELSDYASDFILSHLGVKYKKGLKKNIK